MDFNADKAEIERQDAMLTQFSLSFEELDETVDRLEQEEVYSEAVAEATREEIETLIRELSYLIFCKVDLIERLRADERELRSPRSTRMPSLRHRFCSPKCSRKAKTRST
jgi:hypothetical protein